MSKNIKQGGIMKNSSQKEKFLVMAKDLECEPIEDFEKKINKASNTRPISNKEIKDLVSKKNKQKK